MTTNATVKDTVGVTDIDDFDLPRALVVNIKPILESVAGKLTDDEIDQWFVGFAKAKEGRGFYLELTREGELVINPMVNRDSGMAEGQMFGSLFIWVEANGGEIYPSRTIVRLLDGSRTEPDATWLSPEQVDQLSPISDGGAITVCPAFVAEIRSGTPTVCPRCSARWNCTSPTARCWVG